MYDNWQGYWEIRQQSAPMNIRDSWNVNILGSIFHIPPCPGFTCFVQFDGKKFHVSLEKNSPRSF